MGMAKCKLLQIVSLLDRGSPQIGIFGFHIDSHQCVRRSDCLDLSQETSNLKMSIFIIP